MKTNSENFCFEHYEIYKCLSPVHTDFISNSKARKHHKCEQKKTQNWFIIRLLELIFLTLSDQYVTNLFIDDCQSWSLTHMYNNHVTINHHKETLAAQQYSTSNRGITSTN